jgi:hypothetical protein
LYGHKPQSLLPNHTPKCWRVNNCSLKDG